MVYIGLLQKLYHSMQCYSQFESGFQSLFVYKCLVYRVCVCVTGGERETYKSSSKFNEKQRCELLAC